MREFFTAWTLILFILVMTGLSRVASADGSTLVPRIQAPTAKSYKCYGNVIDSGSISRTTTTKSDPTIATEPDIDPAPYSSEGEYPVTTLAGGVFDAKCTDEYDTGSDFQSYTNTCPAGTVLVGTRYERLEMSDPNPSKTGDGLGWGVCYIKCRSIQQPASNCRWE